MNKKNNFLIQLFWDNGSIKFQNKIKYVFFSNENLSFQGPLLTDAITHE